MKCILAILLDYPLADTETELKAFKAFIKRKNKGNDLFHNHTDDGGVMHRQSRIQYRSVNGYAAIFGIEEGYDSLCNNLMGNAGISNNFTIKREFVDIKIVNDFLEYKIQNYIPFYPEKSQEWQSKNTLIEKIELIQNQIVTNILGFCKEYNFDKKNNRIEVELINFNEKHGNIKENNMISFNVVFRTNILLPNLIGIGRNQSMGCGILVKL